MPAEYFSDAATFAQQAHPFWLKYEAENSVMFGILDRLTQNPFTFSETPPLLALLREGQQVAAAVLMTPPHNLLLPVMDLAAIPPLAQDLFADGITIPGTVAPLPIAEAFASAWCALSGQRAELEKRERVYELAAVTPPAPVSGHFRWATPDDRDMLVEWSMGFDRDAWGIVEPDRAEHERWADSIIIRTDYRGLGVWEDEGRMVSYAGFGGRTPHGVRVAPVYTPPELRGRGYASACTAALSQYLLDCGHQRCFLHTDLANPIANKIYQAIGYQPVGDALLIRFLSPES